jgi:hypothetical protein
LFPNAMLFRVLEVPEFLEYQVWPSFVEMKIVPESPTITMVLFATVRA